MLNLSQVSAMQEVEPLTVRRDRLTPTLTTKSNPSNYTTGTYSSSVLVVLWYFIPQDKPKLKWTSDQVARRLQDLIFFGMRNHVA